MNKILIANRSEIACRIIRAAREMGIKTVAVYSEIDENALHVEMANEAYALGGKTAAESYLDMDKIIAAAKATGADAVHPGYGFLSENVDFNRKVRQAGLIFIGPNPESMELLGSKVRSRELMIASGVPVVPGMKSSSMEIPEFAAAAEKINYPVLIKASAGGGGKGMRIVREPSELSKSVESAMRESQSAFGSREVFLEKYIEQPRHIEFQIACDSHGNAIHLSERECSVQRRHQKVIEETPSMALTDELREKMGRVAVKAVVAAGYDSIGTVEFLLDKSGDFYFLEVNARVQVEHPVTEEVTGVDLVKLQIEIADGKAIPFKQDDISSRGHAIECRLYAEDSDKDFMPSSGEILYLKEPSGKGIRFDTGIKQGSVIPVYYDPILSKIISYGSSREEARIRMLEALRETVILGVTTSAAFLMRCLEHEAFILGETYTNFIDTYLDELMLKDTSNLEVALTAVAIAGESNHATKHGCIANSDEQATPWQYLGKFRHLARYEGERL